MARFLCEELTEMYDQLSEAEKELKTVNKKMFGIFIEEFHK